MTDTITTRRPRKMTREANADTPGVSSLETKNQACSSDTQPAAVVHPTKASKVLAMLQRGDGATLADLVAATGWLPHTTRAALTGLRNKGHALTSEKLDGVRRYRIPVAETRCGAEQ
jgi:hypothetical protein